MLEPHIKPAPTPEEISQATAKIQSNWTANERYRRMVTKPRGVQIQTINAADYRDVLGDMEEPEC